MDKFVAWKNSQHFMTPPLVSGWWKWHMRNNCRKSILMTYHYPDLGNINQWWSNGITLLIINCVNNKFQRGFISKLYHHCIKLQIRVTYDWVKEFTKYIWHIYLAASRRAALSLSVVCLTSSKLLVRLSQLYNTINIYMSTATGFSITES